MKKSLVTIVLVFAMLALATAQAPAADPQQPAAQTPQATQPAQGAQPAQPGQATQPAQGAQQGAPGAEANAPQGQQAAAPQQQKTIKNAAEYNAYMSAIGQQDPNAKAQALESFLQTYPDTVVKEDALVLLMASYQQANNPQKLEDAARRVLQANPSNIRALALLSFLKRAQAQSAQNPQQGEALLNEAAQYAQKGLQALQTWPKPEGMSDADFAKQKDNFAAIFNGSIGLAAYQAKNYPQAQRALRDAVQLTPNDFSVVYPLALAYLTPKPADDQNGIFFATRAALLAPQPQLQQQLMSFAKRRYTVFHGGDDGFDQLTQVARQNPVPPQGFQIQPGPTPQEQVAKLVNSKPVQQMSFDEFQMIFQNGAPADVQKVWTQIQGKPIAFEAKVIQSGPKQLMLASTYENIQKNVPDINLTMTDTLPARLVPQPQSMAQVTGTPVSFTPEPFMITMQNGKLAVAKGAASKASAAKGTASKKTATRKRR